MEFNYDTFRGGEVKKGVVSTNQRWAMTSEENPVHSLASRNG
jgi:hypothetical protein